MLEITDPVEKQAVEVAKAKVRSMEGTPKIIATSPATADICDKLDLVLWACAPAVSPPFGTLSGCNHRRYSYDPDMEIVASLKPDWILSPISLQSDLQPKS